MSKIDTAVPVETGGGSLGGLLERQFHLKEFGTTARTEILAGVTTFLTMAYIIFVNPSILSVTGMDPGALFVATCLAAAFGSAMMGLVANYPIALAPGMGLNAFFAFTVVLCYKYSWQQALAAVFLSGVLFLLISIFRIREYIINAIPRNLKFAISAGVGLFLGIIAFEQAKIVVDHPVTLVTLGPLTGKAALPALLCLLGFVLIVALNARNIIGGTLIGILVVSLMGLPFGLATFGGVVSMPPSLAPTLLQLDFSRTFELTFIIVVFSFLFIDVFDNAGTLIGVAHRAGLTDKDGNLPRMKQALIADSFAAMFGATIGTSTTTSYIESASGVAAGGRTGLTSAFVALFFLLALFFSPLAGMVPAYASSAALLFVACVMARGLAEMDWDDITEYAPAVVAAITMPLTYSIATGIGFGFIAYALAKIISGKIGEAKPAVLVLAVLFAVKFAIG
jgi:AGZA family xanthine/uracil permease-like MFS transporter